MAFLVNNTIVSAEPQIVGFGEEMGIDLIIRPTLGHTITTTGETTVEVKWIDSNGPHSIAQILAATTINSNGMSLGIYYPGRVFSNQANVIDFMGDITVKIFGAIIE